MPLWWSEYPADSPLGKPGWILLGLVLAMGGTLLYEMRRYRAPGQALERLSLSFTAFCLLGVLSGFLIQLRFLESSAVGLDGNALVDHRGEALRRGSLHDFGRLVGRHKMVPLLESRQDLGGCRRRRRPWAMLAAWARVRAGWGPGWHPTARLGPAAVGSCSSTGCCWRWPGIGGRPDDFAAETRRGSRKTPASWLPGLGGALDVIDSLLLAAPVAYAVLGRASMIAASVKSSPRAWLQGRKPGRLFATAMRLSPSRSLWAQAGKSGLSVGRGGVVSYAV